MDGKVTKKVSQKVQQHQTPSDLTNIFQNKTDKENHSGAQKQRKWDYMDIMLDTHDQKADV